MNKDMNIELLEKEAILKQLQPDTAARLDELVILESIDSTNNYLLSLAQSRQTIACFAEQQTAGKGQRGKQWHSPNGGQIYFSLLWQFHKPLSQIMGLSLTMGIATARTLRQYGVDEDLQVKWPNDVYYQGQKLVGILVEIAPGNQDSCKVVIGIGVNLYLTDEQAAVINQPYTSLYQILRQPIARNRFAGMLLNECLLAVTQFSEQGLEPFQAEWRKFDYLYNKRITVTSPQQTLTGVMCGISAHGELLLRDAQQKQHTCLNGTVRLAAP